jgi:VWFA-related protein
VTRVSAARLSGFLAALSGAALFAAGAAQDPQQTPPKFRSATDVVTIEASVRNGAKVITGLEARDFAVTDNGVPQDIYQASYGKVPIDVTVALDTSFSVTGALLDRLRRAVVQMMSDLNSSDRLKLITFNMQVSRVVDFTGDVKGVENAIRATSAGGATSIFDALGVALVSANHPDRRQLVVIFTDGDDSMSATEPSQLLEVAQRSNATLTAVLPAALTVPAVSGSGRGAVVRMPTSLPQCQLPHFRNSIILTAPTVLRALSTATTYAT